jgi:transcriptional regulator with XRE-family HTH domain
MKNNNHELTRWVGIRIKLFRNKNNFSQEQLAEATNLHRTYIGSCERGERNISIVNLSKICNSLGIDLKDLFDEAIK